uniref:Glycine N-acyltransferase-like protein n=1 Tax=Acrobeloides nanus TaxID=290746 RepID=A0A914DNB6_9BILA
MNEEQKRKLLELEIKLPDGYHFSNVDFEKDDVEIITKTWKHSSPGDMEFTRAKLRNMPYSLVRDSSGFPVAYEMIDSSSMFTHQYVQPDHRGKGLGNAVERDLGQKCIRQDITPFKAVETYNTEVLTASDRSPYWIRWDYDGKPINHMVMARQRSAKNH